MSAILSLVLFLAPTVQEPVKPAPQTPPKKSDPTATTPARAQDAPGTMISVMSLRGAEVVCEGMPPKEPPKEKEGTPPKETSSGRESAASAKARVEDLVFGSGDGRVAFAVVALSTPVGDPAKGEGRDKIVLVPAADLKVAAMDVKTTVTVRMTPGQLQGQAPFDLERARKDGVDAVLGEKGTPGKEPMPGKDKDNEKPKAPGELEDPTPNTGGQSVGRFQLSTQLTTAAMHANDNKPWARVKDAALDSERKAIGYLLVTPANSSGDTIVVPFNACTYVRAENGKDLVLKLGKTAEQLGTAPKYEKPARGFLSTDQMQRAEEFFGTRGAVGSQG